MKKLNKLFAILIAVLGVTTLKAQNWTDITNGNGNTFTTKYANPNNTDVFETWTGGGTGHAFDWNQTVTDIPDGVYELSANAMYRASKTYGTTTNCVLYATVGDYEYTTPIANFGDYSSREDLGGIETQMKNNDAYKNKIGNIIVENGEAKIGIKSIGELAYCTNGYWFVCKKSTFTFKNVTNTYFIGLQNKINRMLASAVEGDAKVALNVALTTYNTATVENIKGLQVAIAEFMKTASTANPVDVTSYMANPSFEGASTTYWYQDLGYTQNSNRDIKQPAGWNLMYSSAKVGNTQYQSFMPKTDGAKDGNCLYVRHRWGDVKAVEDLRQSVQELPAGQYQLVVSVKGGSSVTDANTLTLSSGSNTATTTISGFDKKNYKDYSVVVNKTAENATLDICYGLKQTSGSEQLYYIDDFRLYYLGEDLSIYKGMCDDARNGAIAARDNGDYVGITGLERTELVNVIDQTETVEETRDAYLAAVSSLEAATNAFVAAKANYATLATEKEIAAGLGITDESIASATATTKTGLVALQDLKVAEYNYIQGTYTESATLGSWTENFAEDLDGEGYKTGGPKYLNEWGNATRTAKQTVKLPAGDYAIYSIGRGQVGTSGYLYYKIGETTNKVDFIMKGNRGRGVDVDGVANFSDGGTYNCNGEGFGWEYRFITFHLDTETEVEIGASVTIQGQWASIYAPVLLTTEASVKALRMTEISSLLGTVPAGKMNATVQSTLDDKVTAAKAASAEGNTMDELTAITTELSEAIDAANVSIAEYEKMAQYIAKANKIDESIAAELQALYNNGTLEKAEPVFQALEVATYNYVATYFTYPVELEANGWTSTGPVGSLSGQHYDGTSTSSYLEQSANAWSSNAWEISYKYEKTLPAGKYIFKVAGRRAAGTGTTMSMLVTNINDSANPVELGSVNDFPEGDTGLGINKAGVTSFDANDEAGFANNGAGRGWQWRYVMFELGSETTVQVAVNAAATTNHQWMSFCNATVQMTEDTYLAANMGALDAPTAAAEALVDTKPMGTDENNALKQALALSVNTGQQLLDKITALETAVANANEWVAAYNEAKVPLVAALERFEAELNDGVNGCKYNVAEHVWNALIVEVGEAACAKDATNDYSGFANAAEELNKAINDVHNWIRTNPTLNAKSATAVNMTNYYLVNASFDEGNTNGWTKTGSQTNNVAWSVTDGTFTATPSGSHYTGDAIWQKVNLAKGAYKLTVNLKAQEVVGHPSQVFVADAAPSWDNNLSDLIASVIVTEFNKDVELSCIFNIAADADVYIGFNQKAGNVANTGIQGSYTIYDFTLTQAANQIITKDGVITVVGENEAADLAGISSDENIVKVDLTGAMWSEASTLDIVNKNSLVYVTDDTDLTANNIVKVGVDEEGNTTRVAESIVLTEGYKFAAREAFTATALNYAREFSANWLTVCLPFAYEIPEGVKVETLGAVDLDTKTFTFNEVTGTMDANKPYIIKNSSATASLFAELGNVTVEATPEAMTVEVTAEGSEHKAEFIGTYKKVTTNELMEDGTYDILFFGTDGQLYFLSQGVTEKVVNIKPFRAYIRLPKDAINWSDGQQAIARHGEGATDIEDVESAIDNAPVIYDLMGRKVTTMEKGGLYIVNGKKVVIK